MKNTVRRVMPIKRKECCLLVGQGIEELFQSVVVFELFNRLSLTECKLELLGK
jgi:hypothetical protein